MHSQAGNVPCEADILVPFPHRLREAILFSQGRSPRAGCGWALSVSLHESRLPWCCPAPIASTEASQGPRCLTEEPHGCCRLLIGDSGCKVVFVSSGVITAMIIMIMRVIIVSMGYFMLRMSHVSSHLIFTITL